MLTKVMCKDGSDFTRHISLLLSLLVQYTANCSIALQDPNCLECGFDIPICTLCRSGYKAVDGQCTNEGMTLITPHACARGKAIGHVVVVVSTKIAVSQDAGIQGTRKHSESIEFGEKLASVCVKSRDAVHNRQKWCPFVGHCSHTYRQCLLNA